MKKFLVLYRAPVSAADQMKNATPQQAKAGMDAWMAWAGKAGSSITDMGAPLAAAVTIAGKPAAKSAKAAAKPPAKSSAKAKPKAPPGGYVGGYGVVQADTAAAAKKLFDKHPHLTMPGASIELYELMPMPGM